MFRDVERFLGNFCCNWLLELHNVSTIIKGHVLYRKINSSLIFVGGLLRLTQRIDLLF
jgi:hypothetical protein